MKFLNGDCLKLLNEIDDNSVGLVFCDLPYGQTSCKWDCKIDLVERWKQFKRIRKINIHLSSLHVQLDSVMNLSNLMKNGLGMTWFGKSRRQLVFYVLRKCL